MNQTAEKKEQTHKERSHKKQECKKVLLFYNPNAGSGMFKNNLDLIIERFQQKKLLVVPVRASRGELLNRVLEEMDPSEYRQIIVAGGDGTLNICVNAMMRHGIDLPLALFPAGTANDFAYCLGLPSDIRGMIEVAIGNHWIQSDLGKVNDRYFINVAALGTVVDVSQKTDPGLKTTLGMMSYYIRGLQEVPNLRPIPITLTSEDYSGEENMYFMLVMNGKSAGGFKKITPTAEIDDGLFDVIVFREMPLTDVIPLIFDVMQEKHRTNKNILYFRTNRLRIESEKETGTDVDGEKGEPLPLEFSMLPGKLRIFVPAERIGEKEPAGGAEGRGKAGGGSGEKISKTEKTEKTGKTEKGEKADKKKGKEKEQ